MKASLSPAAHAIFMAAAAILVVVGCEDPASATDVRVNVAGVGNDSATTARSSQNYSVTFFGINPLRYSAVIAASALPAPPALVVPQPAPASGAKAALIVPLGTAIQKVITDYANAANAVDNILACDNSPSWQQVLVTKWYSDCKNHVSTGNETVQTLITTVYKDLTDTLATSYKAAITANPADPLGPQAQALETSLLPIFSLVNVPTLMTSQSQSIVCGFDGSGGQTVVLSRSANIPGPTAIKSSVVASCAPKLAIAAGILVGKFGSPTYSAAAPVGTGVTTTPTLVSVTQTDPGTQVKTVAELHVRLVDSLFYMPIALHLSLLGSFVSTPNGLFNGGVGLSASVIDDHLFFTAGTLYTQRNLLTPGTGQLVPGTTVPTAPTYAWPLTVGLTLRL